MDDIRELARQELRRRFAGMDHGEMDAIRQQQIGNIPAAGKYAGDLRGRVNEFVRNPAEALYKGFENTLGINLGRPIAEYAEMARNPQAGQIDPNSPAIQEAMGWLPGPMGALGTISGKGAKPTRELFHGSTESLTNIEDKGLFGGLFAGSEETALSHGPNLHKMTVPEDKILTQHAINYDLDHSKSKAIIQDELHWLDDDQVETVMDRAIYGDDAHSDEMAELLKVDSPADASWDGQRLRGIIAEKHGYEAVEMADEHGTTYLVLPGVGIESVSNPNSPAIQEAMGWMPGPMDEASRMQRAMEMGFDTDVVHGTDQDILQFSGDELGKATGSESAKKAHWVIENSRKGQETAGAYADLASDKNVTDLVNASNRAESYGEWDKANQLMAEAEKLESTTGKGENIIPLKIRGNMMEFDADGQWFTQIDDDINILLDNAKNQGFDGVKISNLVDDPRGVGLPATHYAVFDPKNIRSKFAEFDPSKKESANLLAGLGGLGLGLGYLWQQEEYD